MHLHRMDSETIFDMLNDMKTSQQLEYRTFRNMHEEFPSQGTSHIRFTAQNFNVAKGQAENCKHSMFIRFRFAFYCNEKLQLNCHCRFIN